MNNPENTAYSENIQMYLVEIRRWSGEEQPLPLPKLAGILGISVPSVNEMIKKLDEQGFVDYVPYTGVKLTGKGENLAGLLLRKHRLWEVFLVEELGFGADQAHEIACQLEHATPDDLAERLSGFLDHPRTNPTGEPIPAGVRSAQVSAVRSLADCAAGDCAVVRSTGGEGAARSYFSNLGLMPGRRIKVLAGDPERMLVEVGEKQASLTRDLAYKITVQECPEAEPADGVPVYK